MAVWTGERVGSLWKHHVAGWLGGRPYIRLRLHKMYLYSILFLCTHPPSLARNPVLSVTGYMLFMSPTPEDAFAALRF